ncbi:MAG: hypothetical protein ACK4N5_24465, partial [Myxococcales bacterium]
MICSRLALFVSLLVASSCSPVGFIDMGEEQKSPPELPALPPPGPGLDVPGSRTCATFDAPASLDGLADRYARELHPLMVRPVGGCAGCHGPSSGRPFVVTADGAETFHKMRAGGFLSPGKPGALFDRLVSGGDDARMPRGGPYFASDELDRLHAFLCELEAWESSAPQIPPDEEFPRELLQPWTGPKSAYYDNTFIGFEQLKGRVKVVFDDDWVRNAQDQFQKNIALFGGVDFKNTFIEARAATPEFLLALDQLGRDVCGRAVANKTGPFTGLDTATTFRDTP